MIVLKTQLKKIIAEEAKKVILERELRIFILQNLTEQQKSVFNKTGEIPEELVEGVLDWLRTKGNKLAGAATLATMLLGTLSPMATAAPSVEPSIEAPANAPTALENTKNAANNVKNNLTNWYKSEGPETAFRNFVKKHHAPMFDSKMFKDEKDRNMAISDHYKKEIGSKILSVVNNIKVLNTIENADQIPPNVQKKFSNIQIGGLYDPVTNAIYMNPKSFEATNESDIDTIMATMEEEFFHAIDSNVKAGDVFPSLQGAPQADIQFAMSKSLGRSAMEKIIVSQEESGLDKKTYDYLTNPQEFWSKMAGIKMNMPAGELDDILRNPSKHFKRGKVDLRIFQILQKDKKEEINDYFKQIVKVDKKAPTSQIA